ncbi:MAG: hypothetical protein CVT47_00240 [Thermoplasmata archaeon HGW-Thermoplasmata-2]|nr:MAG: hypothetical protein CVT47_00240 [Thermoplasmata archaeon HGW-Thermoplasmata-2]
MPAKKKSESTKSRPKSKPIYIEPIESEKAAHTAHKWQQVEEIEGDEVQSKSKVSSWPSWEEAEEAPEVRKELVKREDEAQFELEKEAQFKPEPIQEVEPNYEARRKGHALKSNEGIMVVYDAPTSGESSVIEINMPAPYGKMEVDIEIEQTATARVGFSMAIIGAFVTIAGIIMAIFSYRIEGWHVGEGIEARMTWEIFTATLFLLGVGAVLLLLGVTLTTYGRRIKQKG